MAREFAFGTMVALKRSVRPRPEPRRVDRKINSYIGSRNSRGSDANESFLVFSALIAVVLIDGDVRVEEEVER
jgi:hypothetical protein